MTRPPSCESEIPLNEDGTPVRYDPDPRFDRLILAYAFRPFFILASAFAALTVLIWAGFWFEIVPLPESIVPAQWHAHEMIFGFAGAALCGFLLTAVPEWTLTPPRTGRWIALLVLLWLAGRMAMLMAGLLPLWLVAAINIPLFLILGLWTLPALWGDRLKRHRSFIAFLPALWAAQLVIYIGWVWPDFAGDLALRGLNAGVHLFLAAVSLVLTRVSMVLVPLALEEQGDEESEFRPLPPRRNLAVSTIAIFAIADFIAPNSPVTAWIALATAAAQLDRMADWHVGRVLLKPYILTIYLTHFWMVVGFAGIGFDILFAWDGFAASRHALSLGAASLAVLAVFLIAGMRHTGRDVIIGPMSLLAVALVNLAVVLRVVIPALAPDYYVTMAIGGSSLAWSGAFVAYLIAFFGPLTQPRIDGAPG